MDDNFKEAKKQRRLMNKSKLFNKTQDKSTKTEANSHAELSPVKKKYMNPFIEKLRKEKLLSDDVIQDYEKLLNKGI